MRNYYHVKVDETSCEVTLSSYKTDAKEKLFGKNRAIKQNKFATIIQCNINKFVVKKSTRS